jgi:hypothetical protein
MTRSTSIEAYKHIQETGLLTKLKWDIYKALYHDGPLTQNELISRNFHNTPTRSLTPRFAELNRLGVIRVVGRRMCSTSGRDALVWDVTSNLPVPEVKRESLKQQLKAAEEKLNLYRDIVADHFHELMACDRCADSMKKVFKLDNQKIVAKGYVNGKWSEFTVDPDAEVSDDEIV